MPNIFLEENSGSAEEKYVPSFTCHANPNNVDQPAEHAHKCFEYIDFEVTSLAFLDRAIYNNNVLILILDSWFKNERNLQKYDIS